MTAPDAPTGTPSDTPMTDSAELPAGDWHRDVLVVSANFARALEKEASSLRQALEPFTQMRTDAGSFVPTFTAAVVNARACLAALGGE